MTWTALYARIARSRPATSDESAPPRSASPAAGDDDLSARVARSRPTTSDESAPPRSAPPAAWDDGLYATVAPSHPTTSDEGASLVEARDLFKIYREGAVETVALRGANLALPRGAVTSLVGPSGSGKSSLIAILAGLSLPSAGQVLFDGEDLTRSDEAGRARLRARRIGIVLQRGNLVPFLTAVENVELALKLAGGRRARRRSGSA